MTEEEEFEFRLRLEKEASQETPAIPPFSWARKSGFVKGYLDPAAGLAQLSQKALPERMRAPGFDEFIRKEEQAYEAPEGFDFPRMAGNIFNPVSLAPIGQATTIPRATAMGSGMALTQPTTSDDYWKSKGVQAVTGATLGAAFPLTGKAIRGGVHYADELTKPMYERGIQRDVKKFVTEAAGEGREKIINTLSKGKGTAGQTIARANRDLTEDVGGQFVSLEKSLSRDPLTGSKLRSVYKAQEKGRQKAIEAISGTPDDLAAAISKRAKIDYQKAFKQAIKGDSELTEIVKNPYIKKAIPTAIDLSDAAGVTPKESLTQFLHYVKIGVDKQLARTGDDALSSTERSMANKAKKTLVNWIKKKNPAYDEARSQYAELSKPINRMQVGQELKEALVSATEKETPTTFTGAIRNAPRTIKRSTGFSRYSELGDVLKPDQVKAVSKIADELLDQAKFSKMATGTKSIFKDLPGEVEVSLPHILSRPVVIANAGLKLLGKDRTPRYKEILSEILEKPELLAEALKMPPENIKRKVALELMKEASIIATAESSAREVQ